MKSKLFFLSLCSTRIRSRKWDIEEKRLQFNSNQSVKILPESSRTPTCLFDFMITYSANCSIIVFNWMKCWFTDSTEKELKSYKKWYNYRFFSKTWSSTRSRGSIPLDLTIAIFSSVLYSVSTGGRWFSLESILFDQFKLKIFQKDLTPRGNNGTMCTIIYLIVIWDL